METRKVQRLGPSTLAMTLPAEWASEHGVEKGDEVSLRMGGKGTLTVLPESADTEESEAIIHVAGLSAAAVERAIVSQYVLGRRVIHVEAPDGETLDSAHINAVYNAETQLMGLGVIEETPERIAIRCSVDPEDFTLDNLLERLESVANGTVASTGDRYLTSDATPSTWTRAQHEAAFGSTPAAFTYELASASASYRIEGPYRNVSTDDIDRLATGETLVVPVTVTNIGGSAGTYDIALSVEETVVARATGTLDGNESTTISLTHTFEQPGTYSVNIGASRTTIQVSDPDSAVVESIAVDRATLDAPGTVTLSATVRNRQDFPATASVSFTQNGATIGDGSVSLAPNETRTVTRSVTLSEAGRYELGVNDRTTTVVVDPARFTYAVDETTEITVDGEYRTLSTTEVPPLVVGETVRIPVAVTNDGGLTGEYTANLSIDGDVATRSQGELAAGESTTVALEHRFRQPGSYRISVGDMQTVVQVRDPATPVVRRLDLDPPARSEPGNVTVTATVGNGAPVPAAGEIRFSRDGTTVGVESVSLAVNETLTVSKTVALPRPGQYRIRVDYVTASVEVEPTADAASDTGGDGPTATAASEVSTATDAAEPTAAAGPGFTAVTALLVVVVTVFGFARR